MPWAGFEPMIPVTKRPQTYALGCAATGIGYLSLHGIKTQNNFAIITDIRTSHLINNDFNSWNINTQTRNPVSLIIEAKHFQE
jgi:hypothetical protein